MNTLGGIAESGWLKGRPIRTARKGGECADYRHCRTMIAVGDRYVEGDDYRDNFAGRFGRERFCLPCAGIPATAPP